MTLSGWDFSLEGGWQVIANANNVIITHNNFKVGANLLTPIGGGSGVNISVLANVIDGNGQNNVQNGGLISINGTATVEYNVIKNAFYQFIQFGANGATVTEAKWNYFENAGLGHGCCSAHGDWIQDFSSSGGSPVFTSIDHSYNTFVQNDASAVAATQGLSIVSANGNTAAVNAVSVNNNTMIAASGSNVGCCSIIIDSTWVTTGSTVSVQNNYVDPTGVQSSWMSYGQFNGAQLVTNSGTASGNATLHFASTTGQPCTCVPLSGWVIHDLTTPTATTTQTVSGTPTGTTVTMSAGANATISSGDTIGFNDGPFNTPLTVCSNNIDTTTGLHITAYGGFSLGTCS